MENIVININKLKEKNLSINEILILYKLEYSDLEYVFLNSQLKSLEEKKYIKIINNNTIILRQKASNLLESMQHNVITDDSKIKKVSNRKVNDVVKMNLKKYREKFKGLKRGSMGSKSSCNDKLIRWIKENPEYSFDDILKATDLYIESLEGNYKYLQRADYFIFKKEGKEESSRLSAFIDEIDVELSDNDWTSNLN